MSYHIRRPRAFSHPLSRAWPFYSSYHFPAIAATTSRVTSKPLPPASSPLLFACSSPSSAASYRSDRLAASRNVETNRGRHRKVASLTLFGGREGGIRAISLSPSHTHTPSCAPPFWSSGNTPPFRPPAFASHSTLSSLLTLRTFTIHTFLPRPRLFSDSYRQNNRRNNSVSTPYPFPYHRRPPPLHVHTPYFPLQYKKDALLRNSP